MGSVFGTSGPSRGFSSLWAAEADPARASESQTFQRDRASEAARLAALSARAWASSCSCRKLATDNEASWLNQVAHLPSAADSPSSPGSSASGGGKVTKPPNQRPELNRMLLEGGGRIVGVAIRIAQAEKVNQLGREGPPKPSKPVS